MGRKIVGVYVCLNILAVLFEVIAAFMTWHSTRFMILGATHFRMKVGLLTASIDEGASLLCRMNVDSKYCNGLDGGFTLRDAAQQWCAATLVSIAPEPCQAFSTAFYIGLLVTVTLVLNIIVLAVSCWLLYRYAAGEKHKPMYRHSAVVMHIFATVAMIGVTLAYSLLVGQQLDRILTIAFVAGTGSGNGYGQIVFIVAIVLQAAAAGVTSCIKLGDEQTEEDYIVSMMNKEKLRGYGAAKGFSKQDGDPERGYNQAFTNGPTFVPGQTPAPSPQPLAPQPAFMGQQAVPGPPMMAAMAPYAGAPAQPMMLGAPAQPMMPGAGAW